MLGLFLLGLVCHKVKRTNGVVAVAAGLAVIAWMSFWAPLHTYLTIVLGTTAIFLTGFVLTKVGK
jgi:SSS family solute:Na+ symporter